MYGLDPTLDVPGNFERLWESFHGLSDEPLKLTPAPLCLAELSLRTLDMDAIVARLEAIQSLEAAHVALPDSRYDDGNEWKGHERTVVKGTSHLPGSEQWYRWVPGKRNRAGLVCVRFVSLFCDGRSSSQVSMMMGMFWTLIVTTVLADHLHNRTY